MKRRTWVTQEHFENMYKSLYDEMVDCGVAEKMDEEKMFDKSGNITENKEEMYGRPSRYKLIHPERCLFVDETGCNTNQKGDAQQGGKLFVMDDGQNSDRRMPSWKLLGLALHCDALHCGNR